MKDPLARERVHGIVTLATPFLHCYAHPVKMSWKTTKWILGAGLFVVLPMVAMAVLQLPWMLYAETTASGTQVLRGVGHPFFSFSPLIAAAIGLVGILAPLWVLFLPKAVSPERIRHRLVEKLCLPDLPPHLVMPVRVARDEALLVLAKSNSFGRLIEWPVRMVLRPLHLLERHGQSVGAVTVALLVGGAIVGVAFHATGYPNAAKWCMLPACVAILPLILILGYVLPLALVLRLFQGFYGQVMGGRFLTFGPEGPLLSLLVRVEPQVVPSGHTATEVNLFSLGAGRASKLHHCSVYDEPVIVRSVAEWVARRLAGTPGVKKLTNPYYVEHIGPRS